MSTPEPTSNAVRADLPGQPAPRSGPRADLEEMVQVWTPAAQWAVVGLVLLAGGTLAAQHFWSATSGPQGSVLDRSENHDARIDLNRAERAELVQVPGLGEGLADRILERRAQRPFQKLDDLLAVPGIGPARLEKLRAFVFVGTEAAVGAAFVEIEPRVDPELPAQPRIDINRASLKELDDLPGIGPKLAERIIKERQHQPFKSVDDLQRVDGIGPKTVEKLRARATVGP
ncbi:MAG: ComEA family DNA-binding protein [Gemmataceae bacterium]